MKLKVFSILVMSIATISTFILENRSSAMDIKPTSEKSDSKTVSCECECCDTFYRSSNTTLPFHENPYKYKEYEQHHSEQLEEKATSAFKEVSGDQYNVSTTFAPSENPFIDTCKSQKHKQDTSELKEKEKSYFKPVQSASIIPLHPHINLWCDHHRNPYNKSQKYKEHTPKLKRKKIFWYQQIRLLPINPNRPMEPNFVPLQPILCVESEVEEYKSGIYDHKPNLKEDVISPDDTSKKRDFDVRAKCLICGWTGYPDHYYKMIKCRGCGFKSYSFESAIRECCKGNTEGLELRIPCPSQHIHNGFICDKRLSSPSDNESKFKTLKSLKERDEEVWFYCYSCKEYYTVHINLIKHPNFKY